MFKGRHPEQSEGSFGIRIDPSCGRDDTKFENLSLVQRRRKPVRLTIQTGNLNRQFMINLTLVAKILMNTIDMHWIY